MLSPRVLLCVFLLFVQNTIGAVSPVLASHCSTEYGSRSLRSVPSYTHTTTLTSLSTVIVLSAATVGTTASLPQVTVTATSTVLTPKPVLLEDVLRGYQSEYILAHGQPTTLSSTISYLLSASSPASRSCIPQPAALEIYSTQIQSQRRPSIKLHLSTSEWGASQYPEYVYCSRSITYISRTSLTANMKSTTTATGLPSMQTTTVMTTVYAANFTQKPAATTTTSVTTYTPAQLRTVKNKDDEL